MEYKIKEERISAAEYIEFLKHTDLGSQYPKERFEERISILVEKAAISLTARDPEGHLVGVCFCITDFAYWLFITDLGVDRARTGQGIGKPWFARPLRLPVGRRISSCIPAPTRTPFPSMRKSA